MSVIIDALDLIVLRMRAKLKDDMVVRLDSLALPRHVGACLKAVDLKKVVYATLIAGIVMGLGCPS